MLHFWREDRHDPLAKTADLLVDVGGLGQSGDVGLANLGIPGIESVVGHTL